MLAFFPPRPLPEIRRCGRIGPVRNRRRWLSLAIAGALAGAASAAIASPARADAPPLFEDLTLWPASTPATARGLSGGPLPAAEAIGREQTPTGACIGFIDDRPDHRIQLGAFFDYLRLEVQSVADTSLVVRGPGGSWCNDNFDGLNPGIAGQWLAGTYEIWVGSASDRKFHPYVIRFSEVPRPGERPAEAVPPGGAPPLDLAPPRDGAPADALPPETDEPGGPFAPF